MKKIYLDYAASTPVDKRVLKAMASYFDENFGNPGSIHSFGQAALAGIDKARQAIAKAIAADFNEIIFTGSATEANNLALRSLTKDSKNSRIIISSIEHESVLDTAKALEREGLDVVYLPVSKAGFIDQAALKKSLTKNTVLVSVMYANNEIGTIQPIVEIVKIVKSFNPKIIVHTDAVQAFQFLSCDVGELGVDLMTLSAHKIYGPKGAGLLYVRGGAKNLRPIVTGGGQEFGLRSGTENVPNIVGFGEAVKLAESDREQETKKIGELKDYFWRELKKILPKIELNGSDENSLPNILNIYFPKNKSEDLLIKLDQTGIAVSSGSACSARASKPSHVLKALGWPLERIQSSLRFSFGKFTTKAEMREVLRKIGGLTKSA